MAAELTHRLSANVIRRALPALSLTTDTSFLTACSNDDGFDYVFARQVEALGRADDVLLGLSTSGNSVQRRRRVSSGSVSRPEVDRALRYGGRNGLAG